MSKIINTLAEKVTLENALLFFILMILFAWISKRNRCYQNLPPEPPGFPLIGHLPFLYKDIHLKLDEYRKKYGSVFRIRFARKMVVVLGNFKTIKATYTLENLSDRVHELWWLSPNFRSIMEMNGNEWQNHRRFLVSALRDDTNRERPIEDIMQREMAKLLKHLHSQTDEDVNIRPIIGTPINNLIFSLIWGKFYKEDDPMIKFLLELQRKFIAFVFWRSFTFAMGIPVWLKFMFPSWNSSYKLIQKMDDCIRSEIEAHEKELDCNNPRDFIDLSLLEIKKPESLRKVASYEVLSGTSHALLIGGSETVRASIEWILLLMAKRQDLQDYIYEEILTNVSERKPEWGDREMLPYTRAFIMESQRYFTVVPVNFFRRAPQDIQIDGYDVPKETWILPNHWAVHNDPELWKDPSTFDPNRFLSIDRKRIVVPEYWIPFSYGNRNCFGDKIAKMELFLLTTSIIQSFKVLPPNQGLSLEAQLVINYYPKKPVVRFQKR